MAQPNQNITSITKEQRFFILGEEKLHSNLGRHMIQVPAGELWLLYCDGALSRQLLPGRHAWWNGFMHEWRIQKVNTRVELIAVPVKGRIKGPSMETGAADGVTSELACEVMADLEITCKFSDIENFIQYNDPLSVFLASINNLVVELIGRLSYDQYGQWATVIRDMAKDRLGPGGRDDAERRMGIRVEDVFVTDFKPSNAHDRNVLQMYQLVERGKRELFEARERMKIDVIKAESFQSQGQILDISPSILALKESPIGKALIDRDAELQKLLIATGINPALGIQNIQETPSPFSGGTPSSSLGYLRPPRDPNSKQLTGGTPGAQQVTGQIENQTPQSGPLVPPTTSPGGNNLPVDKTLQAQEIAELQNAGFEVAGTGKIQPSYNDRGEPIPGSNEWVLQVTARLDNGFLAMVFYCPMGYPNVAPQAKVKSSPGSSFQPTYPNTIHSWNAGRMLVQVAREIVHDRS